VYVRVVDGSVKAGDQVKMMATDRSYEVKEVGIFRPSQPKMLAQPKLGPGDVGYVIANMKTSSEVKVGDTLTSRSNTAPEPLPGFQEIQPMVFSGIYPINTRTSSIRRGRWRSCS
jgi:GTP-binding protein LepA